MLSLNVVLSSVCVCIQDMFALSGVTQVCAKAFTSLALAAGVSFPVVTLAKSGGRPCQSFLHVNILIRKL